MGMPVKLSDDLVKIARKEADAANRSITAQIEHWATLGRSVETALRHEDVLALKHAKGDIGKVFAGATSQAVYETLRRVAAATRRSALSQKLTQGRTVYQSDPDGSGLLMRIEPDGRRSLGRMVRRRFIPARLSRRPATR